VQGRDQHQRTQPGGEVSDHIGFGSEAVQFRERSLRSERRLAGLTAIGNGYDPSGAREIYRRGLVEDDDPDNPG